MTRIYLLAAAALAALAISLSPADAQTAARAWVSGKGTDAAGCGAPTNACRSFQYAHDNIVAAGGEIDVLDPSGYGAITIGKAITINNDGVGVAGVQQTGSGMSAITINAGTTDAIFLRGLTIEGNGTGGAGVFFNTGGRLIISNCIARNFTDHGIKLAPTGAMSFIIANTITSDNGNNGVDIEPVGSGSASGSISGLETSGNGELGVAMGGTKLTSAVNSHVSITNSVASNNGQYGIGVQSSTMFLLVVGTSATNNATAGFGSQAGGVLTLASDNATGNGAGILSTGTVNTYGNNAITGNTADVGAGTTLSNVSPH